MDAKKYEKIKDFLAGWGYKPEQLVQYIRTTAPALAPSVIRAQKQEARNFFDDLLGKPRANPKSNITPIPKPENASKQSIESDIYIMLGCGPDALTLEDLSDYIEQRELNIKARNTQEAEGKRMFMSNMLRDLNQEDYQADQQWFKESFENSERLRNQKVDMNELLRNAPGECDSTPKNIHLPDVRHDSSSKNDPFNAMLRQGVDFQDRA